MSSEPSPLRRSDGPEDTTECLTCLDGSSSALEDVRNTDTNSHLTESTGELYWGLTRHDGNYKTLFGDARQVLALLPELEDVTASLFPEATVVADIPSFLQEQIDRGELGFQIDRSGNYLAHLVDQNGRMHHVLRLDTKHLTPELSQAWNNLRTRVVQLEIMKGLRDIEEAVSAVKAGQQDDRLALVDSAWSLIEQAREVSDSDYRKRLLNQALDKAIEGRDQLTRSIDRDLADLKKYRERWGLGLLRDEATTLIQNRQLGNNAAITTLSSFAQEDQKPLLAEVLSSHARALEICGADIEAPLMLSSGDASTRTPTEEEEPVNSSIAVPTCDECGRDIETGAALCAYHRGKKREKRTRRFVVAAGLTAAAAKKYGPTALRSARIAAKVVARS